ncbi:MAG: YdbL family protein [Alphaproteobacteria bacterium]|nr:YdbL family protein [Alphaproteobacteria bacterium]
MKLRFFSMLVVAALLMATSAWALDLHQARSSGMVGEKADGYIAALQSTPELQALVSDVNAKRQQEYARISAQNGQPVDVVAKLAAQQIVGNLQPGNRYQGADGGWKTK